MQVPQTQPLVGVGGGSRCSRPPPPPPSDLLVLEEDLKAQTASTLPSTEARAAEVGWYQEQLASYQQVVEEWRAWADHQGAQLAQAREVAQDQEHVPGLQASLATAQTTVGQLETQVAGLQEQVQGSAAEDRARTALLEVTDLRKTVDRLESEKEEQGEEVERLRGHVAREQGLLVQKEQDLQHHEAELERLGVEAAREDAAREARERQDSDRGSMDRELSVESHGIPAENQQLRAEVDQGAGPW